MLYDPNSRGAYSAINKGCQGNTHNRFHLIKEKGNFIETDYIESSELSQVEFMQAVAKVVGSQNLNRFAFAHFAEDEIDST